MCRTAYGRINSGFRPEEHIFRWGRGINPSLYHFVAWCCRAVEERDTIFQIMHKESGGGSPRIPQHRSPAQPSLRAITENLEGSWRISDDHKDHKRHTNTKEYGEKKRTQTHKWINEINQLSSKVFSKMDSQLQLSNCSPKHVTSYHRCGGEQPKASNWTRFVFVVSNNFENSTATERMRLPLTSSQELVIFVWFCLVWFGLVWFGFFALFKLVGNAQKLIQILNLHKSSSGRIWKSICSATGSFGAFDKSIRTLFQYKTAAANNRDSNPNLNGNSFNYEAGKCLIDLLQWRYRVTLRSALHRLLLLVC